MTKKILLIEDSEATSKNITINLQGNGYEVFSADTITQGLGILSKTEIGLIIADIDLKNSNIVDYTRDIFANPRYNLIPLLILTDEAGVVPERNVPGSKAWIIKPFSADKLLNTVRNLSV